MSWDDNARAAFHSRQARDKREKNLRLTAWAFAAVAVVASGGGVFHAVSHRDDAQDAVHWRNAAKKAGLEILVADEVAKELRRRLDDEKALGEALKAQLADQEMRYGQDLKRLAGMDEQLEAAGFDSVSAALAHVYLHERQASDLARWWRWEKRDSAACMCKLGGDRNCKSTKVDYGGEVNP